MKPLFLLVLLLPAPVAAFCQNANIDSLRRVIETTKVDTVRGRSLCRLGAELRTVGRSDESRDACTLGREVCRQANDPMGEGMCVNNLGNYYLVRGDYARALDYYHESLPLREAARDRIGLASSLSNMGSIYFNQGDFARALEHYRRSLAINQEVGPLANEARMYANIGLVYMQQGNYPSALDHFQQGLQLMQRLGERASVANLLNNIGGIYEVQGDDAQAQWYFEQSLRAYQQLGHRLGTSSCLTNLGMIHQRQGRLDQALAHFEQSRAIKAELGDRAGLALVLSNIGAIYQIQGKPEQALDLFREAYRIGTALNDKSRQAISQANVATLHWQLGRVDSARQHARQSLELAQRVGNLLYMHQAAKVLYRVDSALGNWQAAFEALLLYKTYADSLKNDEQSRNLGRLEARFESEKVIAQRDLAITKLEADRLRNDLILKEQKNKFIQDSLANAEQKAILEANSLRLAQEVRERDQQRERDSLQNASIFERLERMRVEKQAELDRQRLFLGGAGIGLLLVLAIVYILFQERKKEKRANSALRTFNEQIRQQKAEIEAQNSEIIAQRDQLNATNARLVELDRLKDQLTGMIVHDLKNPLNAILGLAALPPDPGRLNIIRGAGQQMSQLVLNLLDIQKYEQAAYQLKPEVVPVAWLLCQAAEQTQFLAEQKQIRFQIEADPRLAAEADAELIVRVLVNLLTNAIKYAPAGDVIEIQAVYDPERGAVFRVTDHGKGIPPDQLDRIFDKFSQVDGGQASGKLRSTGLGLTFCRLTVEAHGGRIDVRSEVGRFTIFEFNLPSACVAEQEFVARSSKEAPVIGPLSAELQAQHAQLLSMMRNVPIYSVSDLLDLLERLPDQPPELAAWKAALETAALSANEARFRELLA